MSLTIKLASKLINVSCKNVTYFYISPISNEPIIKYLEKSDIRSLTNLLDEIILEYIIKSYSLIFVININNIIHFLYFTFKGAYCFLKFPFRQI